MNSLLQITLLSLLSVSITTVQAQDEEKESAKPEKAVAAQQYTDEVRAISQKSAVKKALAMFPEREAWTRQNLITLTEIPAPPFKEEARGRAYAEMLRAAGADSVWIDKVGNVLAKRRGKTGKKTVVLDAHLDTVFPEETDVKIKMRGDTLYAPGVGDDTRGLAMVLTILDVMEKTGVETDANVLFIGTVGEEGLGDLRGESPEQLAGINKLFQTAVQRALKEENAMKRIGPGHHDGRGRQGRRSARTQRVVAG